MAVDMDGDGETLAPVGGYGSRKDRLENLWKKNKGLIRSPRFWWLMVRLAGYRVRRLVQPSPALAKSDVMFVGTHHKVMTTYFSAVLKLLCKGLGIRFDQVNWDAPDPKARMVLLMHSSVDLARLGRYRGVHVFRDPRDMIVSGYHYHKWTAEAWAHVKDESGESYQDKLNRLPRTEGLFAEIDHFLSDYEAQLNGWNVDDPDILEVKFADLMGPEKRQLYDAAFAHLGFEGGEKRLAVDLMTAFEAGNRSGKKKGQVSARAHIRSAASGQWEKELEPAHLAYIEEKLGPVLDKFGYR